MATTCGHALELKNLVKLSFTCSKSIKEIKIYLFVYLILHRKEHMYSFCQEIGLKASDTRPCSGNVCEINLLSLFCKFLVSIFEKSINLEDKSKLIG